MRKKTAFIIAVIAVLAAIAAIGNNIYIEAEAKTTFPSNTIVNSVDCSGLTEEQAIEQITRNVHENDFVILGEGKELCRLGKLTMNYDLAGEIHSAMRTANIKDTILSQNSSKEQKITLWPVDAISYLEDKLAESDICTNKDIVKTKNAYVELDSGQFNIVPEIYGTSPDKTMLANDIIKAITHGKWSLNYNKEEYYEIPTITKESEEIINRQAYCKTHLAHKITYKFGNKKITLKPEQLDKMLVQKSSGKVVINEEGVIRFVKKLAKKYDTLNKDRQFQSTARGTVFVSPGTFGYKINKKKEIKQLSKDLLGCKDVTREPAYSSKGNERNINDIGSTYVEVDLAMQHFWFYNNGEIVVDADIVTGCTNLDHYTVTGVYYIQYKTRDVTLKGREDDGTEYESDVEYWMPFYYDYGLHDAKWRGAFGGQIYQYGGSHGCVNLPFEAARTLYENVYVGCPVVIFN